MPPAFTPVAADRRLRYLPVYLGSEATPTPGEQLPAHGKVPWMVRAIWEEHLGWFRYESTTELYNVPPAAVYGDLVELGGGPERIIGRARQHLHAGRPLEAMHLAEAVLASAPKSSSALGVKLEATEFLLAHSTRENFSETRWLEAEIRSLRTAIENASV
jgi:alkyl sulfatase BDS1-like metallo-beta-lactamase superfamily hydrolase